MTPSPSWFRLFLLLCCLQTCYLKQTDPDDADDKARGFPGTETSDGVWVSTEGRRVLTSGLTTVFLPIVYIVVFVVGLPTNAVAIWVFLFRTKKKHPSSVYMANLALADLLFVIWVPLEIAYHFNGNDWVYGPGLCKVLVAFFYGNMYCSIAFIACISVQRYWAVVHPFAQKRSNAAAPVLISVAVWAVVWLATIPLFLYDQEVRVSNLNIRTCHDVTRPSQKKTAAGYFLTMGVLGFVLPAVVCVVSYVLMLKTLRNSMADPATGKKRRKAVVLIVTVLVMFVVCFTPSNVMLLVHYVHLLGGADNSLYGFYVAALCLASLNSCLDPFIYYFISEEFREHVRNTFLCRSERTAERMRVSFSALKYSRKRGAYSSESGNTHSTDC
ncbi:proteinase-activated receptor 2 [Brachionichthys hirsutus]|uniref:proteinase-activated receptor 2 n=1 Tax=Brachionichthys hirsutus TaxID=412623 RepID=UPI0036047816